MTAPTQAAKRDVYTYFLSGVIDVPAGTLLNECGTAFILPDGSELGVEAVLEHQRIDGTSVDLTWPQRDGLDVSLEPGSRSMELHE